MDIPKNERPSVQVLSVQISDLLPDSLHESSGLGHSGALVTSGVVANVVGDEEVAVMGDRARDVDDVLRVRLWNRGQRRGVVYDLDGAGHDFSKRLPKSPENWFLWSDLTEVPFAFVQQPFGWQEGPRA